MADPPALTCAGNTDDWTLTLDDESVSFDFLDRASLMQVMQRSTAEGAEWPVAMTVVGPRDSAIVIVEPPHAGSYPIRVLTQRGETPILLAGQCQATR